MVKGVFSFIKYQQRYSTIRSGAYLEYDLSNDLLQSGAKELLSKLIPSCIPSAFCYESLPKIIMGIEEIKFGISSVKNRIEVHENVYI